MNQKHSAGLLCRRAFSCSAFCGNVCLAGDIPAVGCVGELMTCHPPITSAARLWHSAWAVSGLVATQGVMHSADEANEAERAAFVERAHSALDAVLQSIPFDSTADQIAARFLRQRLPPPIADTQVLPALLLFAMFCWASLRVNLWTCGTYSSYEWSLPGKWLWAELTQSLWYCG